MIHDTLHTFSGTPRQLGRAHGESLREAINASLAWYCEHWWQLDREQLAAKVTPYLLNVRRWAPELAVEIEGIAEGANQPALHIMALNARTELRPHAEALECTSIGVCRGASVAGETMLAQNWDWWHALRGHTARVRLEPAASTATVCLIEPGMVGKIGLSAHGLGVCLNFLSTPNASPQGLPVHVLCRLLLSCATLSEARTLLQTLPHATSAAYLVGDAHGHLACWEAGPDLWHEQTTQTWLTHTNAHMSRDEACMRQTMLAYRLGMCPDRLAVTHLKDALSHPNVLAHDPTSITTLHTIILHSDTRQLAISDGALGDTFETFTV